MFKFLDFMMKMERKPNIEIMEDTSSPITSSTSGKSATPPDTEVFTYILSILFISAPDLKLVKNSGGYDVSYDILPLRENFKVYFTSAEIFME